MRVMAGEGLTVSAEFEVTEHHQGAPGLAHGGVLAAAFDEALGALNWLLLNPAVTVRLETDFRKPVPVGQILHIDARITGVDGRKVYTEAVGRLGGADGPVVLTSAAIFVQVGLEHFQRNGRAEDVDRVAAERAAAQPARRLDVNP
jgi:acyl-coenzyme A thioesterase PaaI-like protein